MSRFYIIIGLGIGLLLNTCTHKKIRQAHALSSVKDTLALVYYKKARNFEADYSLDSAYYYFQKAEKRFSKRQDSFFLQRIFFRKAAIDYKNSDLPAAETNAVKALSYASYLENRYNKYIYNLLGLINKEKKDYQTALSYFNQYRKLYRRFDDTLKSFIVYHNNMSNVYKASKQFDIAIRHLDTILSVAGVKSKYPQRYARVLDNKAYNLIRLHQYDGVIKILDSALQLRKSAYNYPGLIMSYLNYARYYKQTRQLDTAHIYAQKAYLLAKRKNIPESRLESLVMLAGLDSLHAVSYFKKYIHLKDSLHFVKLKAKEQTALIRYESHRKEEQLKQQEQELVQKKIRNRALTIVLTTVLLVSLLLLLQFRKIKKQHQIIHEKNKQLLHQNRLIETIYLEMHHRTKNNLDLISMIFIEQIIDTTHDEKLKIQLQELQSKIMSIKNLHLLLQTNKPDVNIPLRDYTERVIEFSRKAIANSNLSIINRVAPDIHINFKQAYPLGLIINEFITNSIKYAFDGIKQPVIEIVAHKNKDQIVLTLQDNGKGFPEYINFETTNSYGLKMIKSLITQLKGNIVVKNEKGLQFVIRIPVNNK